ncbi:aspartate/glutamate racemase family protein [Paenibacillus sp. NPDC057934]|uniref:aspartate/glutamate racemase family protein n=1 Tax=Paenibacillus sp. NPDC057934 TaxID=3346282 RepID=UPI0036DE5340
MKYSSTKRSYNRIHLLEEVKFNVKTIGLIGGLSYESTLLYYEHINKLTNRLLGKTHSAKLILNSLDNEEVLDLFNRNEFDKARSILIDAALLLQNAGADCILMCCNSVHKLAKEIQQSIQTPLIHISDAVVEKMQGNGLRRIGLIGTNFTMSDSFYKHRLEEHSIEVMLPEQEERNFLHRVIFSELVVGTINPDSKKVIKQIIKDMVDKGAQGIILGCTELPMMIELQDVRVPVFDAVKLHAEKAVEFALSRIECLNPVF